MITFQAAAQWMTGVEAVTNGSVRPMHQDSTSLVPGAVGPTGFAARRNGTAMNLVRTLAIHYPTVVRILGEEAFLDVAVRFIAEQPPTLPATIFYGENLPQFLRKLGAAAAADYVADIAGIDGARVTARHIAGTNDGGHESFNGIQGPDLLTTRAALHLSVVLLRSKYPAVTGWHANQMNGDRWVRRWGAEDALVASPRLDAGVWRLPAGGFEFLTALSDGATFDASARAASEANDAFDLAEILAVLIASDIVTRIRSTEAHRRRTPNKPARHQLPAIATAVA